MRNLTKTTYALLRRIFKEISQISRWIGDHKKIANAINVLLAIAVIIFLFLSLRNDTQVILDSIIAFDPLNLVINSLLYGINFYIFFEIWRILFTGFGFSIDKLISLKIFSSTSLAKFIPSPILFYFARISQLEKAGINAKSSIAITSLEFILQVITGICVLGIINIRLSQPMTLLWLFCVIPCLILFLKPNILNLNTIFKQENAHHFTKTHIINLLILSIIPWLFGGLFFFFILKIFKSSILTSNFYNLWRIWIISNIASMIGSYLFGGLGLLREFTLVIMLEKYYPSSIAIVIAAIVRILLVLFGILWAGIYFFLTVIISYIRNKYQN